MIAAVYARKSTKQSDVNDAEKSVVRQLTLAKTFAAERGWQVIEEYVDDGISGQESAKLVNRARLLADATAGKFTAVIVRDYDRISRDDREGPRLIYDLQDLGYVLDRVTSARGERAHAVPPPPSASRRRVPAAGSTQKRPARPDVPPELSSPGQDA